MNALQVWAPQARRVEAKVGNDRLPLVATDLGWWTDRQPVPPGTDYFFSVDGGPLLPDPRSPWQPNGVHGPSRTVDHRAFPWTDAGFQAGPLSAALIYELHVGTVTPEGTFDALIGKLPHFKSLGVTHIELMPLADFPGEFGWGYDGVALFAPRHRYGGPDGLKRLVDAAHGHGLGVILDVVYNHLGPKGNYLAQYGPYFTNRHSTPWGAAVNFDGAYSDQVRRFFCDNALMWLRDYHFDGLRVDAVHAIVDTSAMPFLEQLATEVDELKGHLGRHLVLIAESDLNDPRVVRPWEMGGFGLDAQWSDDFHHAIHAYITGERVGYYSDFGGLGQLAMAFEQPYLFTGRRSEFRHRQHGRPATGITGHKFLAYLQTHDQVGNRALGDRLSHLASLERTKIAAALVMASPYVPMLFQGEEWAATTPFQYFADFSEDPALAQSVADGRRREFAEFGWKPQDVPDPGAAATFERSKLDWNETKRDPHAGMLEWYRQLIELRRRSRDLTNGRLDFVYTDFDEVAGWLVVERGSMTVVCNFADMAQRVPVDGARPANVLLTSADAVRIEDGAVALPPQSVAILGPSSNDNAIEANAAQQRAQAPRARRRKLRLESGAHS